MSAEMHYYPDPAGEGEGEGGRWVLGYSKFQVTEMIEGFLGVWNFWFCNFLRSENLGGLIKVGIFGVWKLSEDFFVLQCTSI